MKVLMGIRYLKSFKQLGLQGMAGAKDDPCIPYYTPASSTQQNEVVA